MIRESPAYSGIHKGDWNDVGKASVRYLNVHLKQVSEEFAGYCSRRHSDVIYLDSIFATLVSKCSLLRKMRQFPRTPIIIAPRGHLQPGALSLKREKKRLFLLLARRTRLV